MMNILFDRSRRATRELLTINSSLHNDARVLEIVLKCKMQLHYSSTVRSVASTR